MVRGRVTQGSWLEAGVSSPQPAGHLPGHQRQQELIILLLLRGAVLVLCIKEVRDSSVPIGPVVSLGRLEHELERRWRRVGEDALEEEMTTSFQYSFQENPMDKNPMDRGAWWGTVRRVTKSRTRLSD